MASGRLVYDTVVQGDPIPEDDVEAAFTDWKTDLGDSEIPGIIRAYKIPLDDHGHASHSAKNQVRLGSWPVDQYSFDELCDKTLFMQPPTAILRPGGYTTSIALAQAEKESHIRQRRDVGRELKRLRAEAAARQNAARQADRQRSLRGASRNDSDARAKMNLVRVSGKDGKAGRLAAQFKSRVQQVQDRFDGIQILKDYRLGIELTGEPKRIQSTFVTGLKTLPVRYSIRKTA